MGRGSVGCEEVVEGFDDTLEFEGGDGCVGWEFHRRWGRSWGACLWQRVWVGKRTAEEG